MRYRVLGLALLSLTLSSAGAAEEPGQPSAEEAFRGLLRDYEAFRQQDAVPGTEDWRCEFPPRFLALARAHPGSPVACDALGWVIRRVSSGADAEAAMEMLARDHVRNPAIGPICPDLAIHVRSRAAESFLRQVIAHNPQREAQGLACLGLARSLAALAEFGLQRRVNPRTGGFLDRQIVKRIRNSDPDALRGEADALFGRISKEYADVLYEGNRLGELALGECRSLRDLAIGNKAPEIIGEDLDGKLAKLSDYRGKVVVLNFSSHEYCGICRAYYPSERSLVERMKGRPFAFVGVNCDDHREVVRKARDAGEITWRSWWDGGSISGPIATRWNITGWPTVFILDGEGVIRYEGIGVMEVAAEALVKEQERKALAAAAIGGPPLAVPSGFDDVIRAAESIPNAFQRASTLSQIAAAQARSGLDGEAAARATFRRAIDVARSSLEMAKDDRVRGFLLVRLALVQIEEGDRLAAGESLSQAIRAAEQIEPEGVRHDLMQFIAHTQGEAGDVKRARATAAASGRVRAVVLADLAAGQAAAGDVPGALATLRFARTIPDAVSWTNSRALPEIALAQVRAGDREEARRTIDRARAAFDAMPKDVRDASVLSRIALAQAKLGDRDASRATFERALQAADRAGDRAAAECLAKIALAQWEAGEGTAARASLREADDRIAGLEHDNPQLNDLLLQARLELGDRAGALAFAQAARDDQAHLTLSPESARRLARELVRAGDPKHALDWLIGEASPLLRTYALLGALEGAQKAQR